MYARYNNYTSCPVSKFELPTKARQFFGSDSIVRQKYPSKRQTAEEDQEIRKRAAECGKTVSGFLRAAALGKKVNSLTDDRVLKEVMRLGALQKKLFIDGKRVGDREYAEVLIAITEYHRALLSRLMAD
ncbi:plasmid mobilization protein MobA [Escherichia coli]|uniref:plasmid mobilization protein MobA n=2 Tax=Escherichia coli TaxID=562 RepID=UPI0020307042|nr:plasmid mobilization protein MobA [Escherichia coli]